MKYIYINERLYRLSDIEAERYLRGQARNTVEDERKAPRHPNQQGNSRKAMRNLVRWRNKKHTGRYDGTLSKQDGNETRFAKPAVNVVRFPPSQESRGGDSKWLIKQ